MPRGRRILARRRISSIASPSSLSISTHASNVAEHSTEKNRRTAQVSGMKSDNAGSTMSQVRPPASSSRIRTSLALILILLLLVVAVHEVVPLSASLLLAYRARGALEKLM